jgi:hypothetical protein
MRRLTGLLMTLGLLLAALPTTTAGAEPPTIHVADVVVTEPSGRNGIATVAVPVVLDSAPTSAVLVSWRTVAGSAGPSDVVITSGSFQINAGSQGGGVPIDIRADRTAESTESFTLELTSVSGAVIADGIGRIDIRDAATGLAVADVTVMEPDAGGVDITIPITVPSAPSKAVSFAWQLRSGTATVGSDVVAASGSGVIPKGAMSSVVFARISGDIAVEGSEWFELVVDSVKNVALHDGIGRITLVEDDVLPPTPSPTPPPTPTPTPTATATPPPTPTPTPVPTATTPPLDGWMPPSGSIPATGTVVYLESAPGDYIGQGRTYTYTLATAIVAVDPAGDRFSVHVRGDEDWDGWFAPNAAGTPLSTGAWSGLQRYPIFIPGLSWSGEGRGCNTLTGSLVIDEFVGSTVDPDRIVARFEQRCDSSAGILRGFLRYERGDPTTPPPPGDPAEFPWSPPAGAVPASGDYLYFESSAGDYIGQGRTDLYTAPSASFVGAEASGMVRLQVARDGTSWWTVSVTGPDAQDRLLPGRYAGLGRYPFHNPVEGGLSMSGEGRGCNRLAGDVAVDDVVYSATEIMSFTIRFIQRCEETGPPLFGAMRWTRPPD